MTEKSSSTNFLSTSVRIYRTMLAAYPQLFREKYETQMVQVFRDSFKEAYLCLGMPGVMDLWLHTLVDLVFTALFERIAERSKNMFSPKVITWGGLAGAVCGVMWLMMGLATSRASFVLTFIFGLGGLVGLYSWQGKRGGRLGSAGFALGIISAVLTIATIWWGFASARFVYIVTEQDALGAASPLLFALLTVVTYGIGLLLLGFANLSAKIQHRWRGMPIGLGILYILQGIAMWRVYYVPMSQGQDPWSSLNSGMLWPSTIISVLLSIFWIVMGIVLMTDTDARMTQSRQASA